MGRAQGNERAVITGGFDAVLGARRGGREQDSLSSAHPSAQAHEQLLTLHGQLADGQLDDTVSALRRARPLVNARPLLTELAGALTDRLIKEQLAGPDKDRFRGFLWLAGLRSGHAERLLADERGLHVLTDGPDGDSWERRGSAYCGAQVGTVSTHAGETGPVRGAWQQPRGSLANYSWNYARCPECEAAHPSEPECDEQPGQYPLLDPVELAAFSARLQPRVTEAAQRLWSAPRPAKTATVRNVVKKACEDELVSYAAAELAARGQRATRRVLGMGMYDDTERALATRGVHSPDMALTARDWQELLGEHRPTVSNARRFNINSSARTELQLSTRQRLAARYGYAAAFDGALAPVTASTTTS